MCRSDFLERDKKCSFDFLRTRLELRKSDIMVNFTLKNHPEETGFVVVQRANSYFLKSETDGTSVEIPLKIVDGIFQLEDSSIFEDSIETISARLVGLSQEWIEKEDSGFEETGDTLTQNVVEVMPYNPDDIFVENKHFSLFDILEYIKVGDIELSPHFQRHFIWDRTRQSRLIESILLGLPLPSLYMSQYDDGRLTVVDGLQRITTVQRFLDDKLKLTNLEYLSQYNGYYYSELVNGNIINILHLRRFRQTQLQCYIIDYRSPQRLKYDLFRRLNTGGKPLNNQEIRNCLSRPFVQDALSRMTEYDFVVATCGSVRSLRMEDQEVALRFIYFYEQYSESDPTGLYNGNIETALNECVWRLNNRKQGMLEEYVNAFNQSLRDATSLFGDDAFRKVFLREDPRFTVKRNQINKLLLVVICVLLAKHRDEYREQIETGRRLTNELAEIISKDMDFFNCITWSTNAKANISYVYERLKTVLFDTYLRSEK